MTGVEQLTVWLFGILTAAVTVRSIVKLVTAAGTSRAAFRSQAEVQKAAMDAQVEVRVAEVEASSLVFPPEAWSKDGEL